MASLPEFSFRRWSAWAPAMDDADKWRTWAQGEEPLAALDETAPVRAMPPMLRRRAHRLGRAALEALYAPELAYADQPVVFCSRHGEMSRSTALLQALAAEGKVSPQEFSMSVHNAILGLFLIAGQRRAPTISVASENRLALSGITEALAQIANGVPSVILVCCDAPLPELFSPFVVNEPACFAFALEMTAGNNYRLACGEAPSPRKTAAEPATGSSLPLLRFFLDETQSALPLTEAADWQLLRLAPEAGHA
jgi:hypothetical protein